MSKVRRNIGLYGLLLLFVCGLSSLFSINHVDENCVLGDVSWQLLHGLDSDPTRTAFKNFERTSIKLIKRLFIPLLKLHNVQGISRCVPLMLVNTTPGLHTSSTSSQQNTTQPEMSERPGLLDRLKAGPVVGDGSYVFTLEKRGYVHVPSWTPEVVMEHPDAVRELHREYLRSGSDVLQAFSFFASGDKLQTSNGTSHNCADINNSACKLALEVAQTGNALVCGGISTTETFKSESATKEQVQHEFQQQVDAFKNHTIDFLLGEFFFEIKEAEWGIEVLKKSNLPVGITMAMGPKGDIKGVSAGECAVRMARAGADLVGVNCHYDYKISLHTIKLMKEALDAEDLHPYLITQPVGFHVPEVADRPYGYMHLPEYPFALEPRLMTRWDARKYAREAYELGVRYIGGCCGFEPYHIREIAEELAPERGRRPIGADKNTNYGSGYNKSTYPFLKVRNNKDYWDNMKPSFGRPEHPVTGDLVDIKAGSVN